MLLNTLAKLYLIKIVFQSLILDSFISLQRLVIYLKLIIYIIIIILIGSIGPNGDEVFTVRFSPTEVEQTNERFLVISIDNLEKGAEPLVIELEGEAERPVCHFELVPSQYREKKKPELDTSFNVLEFESLGTKVKNTKKFYVVNPTAVGYEFEWKKIEEEKLPAGANI